MSKGWKIFFKILYYLFAFGVGVFLILVVPQAKRDEISFKYLNEYIESKEFVKAVDLLAYVYNADDVTEENFTNNSGLIVFEGLSIYDETVEEVTTAAMNESYICFIYGLDKLSFYGDNNKTILKINDQDVEILSYDYNGDGKLDSIPSLINSTYICYIVNKNQFGSFNSLELVAKDGSTYLKKENINLTFESEFFTTANTFITKYNEGLSDNSFTETESDELYKEYERIHAINDKYQMIDTYKTSSKVYDKASEESVWFMVVFLIWAFILGDCLVGKRYIFSLIKFLFNKIKNKIKPPQTNNDAVGNNFYSLVTFKGDVCEEFEGDIIISYESLTDKQYNFKVVLGKNIEYTIKQRVKGGKYKLTKVECGNFEVFNLPKEIEVKGYTMLIDFNIQNNN